MTGSYFGSKVALGLDPRTFNLVMLIVTGLLFVKLIIDYLG